MSTFEPGPEWVEVPPEAVLPAGSEVQMDMSSGRQRARRAEAADRAPQNTGAADNVARLADRDEISRFVDALFRYATEGTYVALHSFYHDPRRPPADARKHKLQSSEALIGLAAKRASHVANLSEPAVFAPPICTFSNASSASEAHLAEGLALSVECDAAPGEARQLLEGLLGRATVVVASGGTWVDPVTDEAHDKLHLHWRLAEPTREASDHQRLKRARRLAALLANSDATAVPTVHPLRWPGSWHLKSEPRLARIIECNQDQEVHLEHALDALDDAANMRGIPLDDQTHRANGNASLAEDSDLAALARTISNDAATDWNTWNTIGMAFHAASGGSNAGFTAFDEWSAKNEIHVAETTAARWQHWHQSPPTRLTIGKLVYLAR